MPVLNEVDSLEHAVRSVLAQDYAGPQEVVIALGPSTDGTSELAARLHADDPRVVLVDNPDTDIPAGLNRAIAASVGEVVIRVDAHAELPPGYTTRMVDTLERTGAANCGGVMRAVGDTPVQAAVARAYNSPLGLGGGVYHGRGGEGPADSAYLGVFRRDALEAIGGYDPTMRRAEDYELNQRLLAAGGLIWFVPDLEVRYWPRASFGALARQMWATGAWRGELVRRTGHPPVRYLVAPALVTALATSVVVAVVPSPRWLRLAHAAPAAYGGFLGYAVTRRLGATTGADRLLDAAVLATMHLSWGAGFLKGLVAGAGDTVDRSRVR